MSLRPRGWSLRRDIRKTRATVHIHASSVGHASNHIQPLLLSRNLSPLSNTSHQLPVLLDTRNNRGRMTPGTNIETLGPRPSSRPVVRSTRLDQYGDLVPAHNVKTVLGHFAQSSVFRSVHTGILML